MRVTAESIFETNYAENIYRAVLPEAESNDFERSVVDISVNETGLLLNITANDSVSMRSALNTWLRLVQIAYEVGEVTQPFFNEEYR
ncbi:KEOPS complex subunit Pcc1 [Methanohalobium sp.]|uniref:KEOPS complex subunit Pcc1 n=1 Tax=Methanohalobium sp. TaxID=2837493 RepID=UPI0025EE3E2D|nr:KEOPS complex subunit Pcc1 [Methanohalobium sp.]